MNTNKRLMAAMVAFLFSTGAELSAKDALPQLFVPDGQFLTHPIQVYVAGTNLDESMQPGLQLVGVYSNDQSKHAYTNIGKAFFVAANQSWTERISGQTVSREGTLLLFDASDYPLPPYKSTTRLAPVLTWNGTGKDDATGLSTAVGKPVYLGNPWTAAGWTILAMVILIGLIWVLCRKKMDDNITGIRSLISGPDNYMSLWRTQLVAWTLAVGGMVFFFGVIQLQVPKIPESLVALMGMSVATGGLSTIAARSKGKSRHVTAKHPKEPDPHHKPEFSDLITSYIPDLQLVVLSVPKAQMLFWTAIILILFVIKSLLTGELWDVPWEMVTLTGVSQAGYVSDKALHGQSTNPESVSKNHPPAG